MGRDGAAVPTASPFSPRALASLVHGRGKGGWAGSGVERGSRLGEDQARAPRTRAFHRDSHSPNFPGAASGRENHPGRAPQQPQTHTGVPEAWEDQHPSQPLSFTLEIKPNLIN